MVRHEKAGNIAQHFWTLLNEIVKIFAFANTHKYGTKNVFKLQTEYNDYRCKYIVINKIMPMGHRYMTTGICMHNIE